MRRRLTDAQIFLRSIIALVCTLVGTALAFVIPTVMGALLCEWLCGPGPNDFNPYLMTGMLVGLILAAVVGLWGLFYVMKPWIYPYIALKEGHCATCGYNLRGLGNSRKTCPECGKPING